MTKKRKSMPQKFFEGWIKENGKKFKYPPYIFKSHPDYFRLRFSGITPEVSCTIRKDGRAEVFVIDSTGYYWDIITDFDIVIERNSEGKYFCGLCKPQYRTYFASRKEMWEKHVFKEMKIWMNKNFAQDRSICLWRIPRVAWGARIIDNKEIRRQGSECVRIFPLVTDTDQGKNRLSSVSPTLKSQKSLKYPKEKT